MYVSSSSPAYDPAAWSPALYGAQYAEERCRPAIELIRRAVHAAPQGRAIRHIADLGTGTGRHIARLLDAFPDAESIVGTDTSAPMLRAADAVVRSALDGLSQPQWLSKVSFRAEDIGHFSAQPAADLLFSNAALQWLPDHPALFRRLVAQLQPGGVLAVQVPHDLDKPQHLLMGDVAQHLEGRTTLPTGTAARLRGSVVDTGMTSLQSYVDLLRPLCSYVDVWSTTYYHTLTAPVSAGHPIVQFGMGSVLAQVVNGLPEAGRGAFLDEYVRRLTAAYPVWAVARDELGTCFPIERWFMVAVKKA